MSRSGLLTLLTTGSLLIAPAAWAGGSHDKANAQIEPAALTSVAKPLASPFEQRILVEPPPLDRRIAVEQQFGSGAAAGRIEARIRLHGQHFAPQEKPADFTLGKSD